MLIIPQSLFKLWGFIFIGECDQMSEKAAEKSGNVTVLPQFMKENNRNNTAIEIEDKQSWLNNNLHKLMVGVSVIWFAIVLIYITQFFGWSNLFLMMPDEFGGFLAGVTLPLAIIWVVMAYIDRGTSFNREAKFLRAYMNQLVYPEDGAPQTAKAMADAIRSQVVELQQVSKLAHEQTSQIKDAIKENVDDFAKLVNKLDNYSSKTIVELSDGVKFLTANFENILNKAQISSQNLAHINKEFVEGSNGIEVSLSSLFDKILPRLKEMKDMTKVLRDITDGSSIEITKANSDLKAFTDKMTLALNELKSVLVQQSGSIKQVADTAMDNCNLAKNVVSKEISNLEGVLHNHAQKVGLTIEASSKEAKLKTDEIIKSSIENLKLINSNINQGMKNVDESVDLQVKKIDEALAKYSRDISAFVKVLDDRADAVNKKFVSHGELINQELDKLMVRSSNLEETIAIQIANLDGVSNKAVSSIRDVENTLASSVVNLNERIETANNNILNYSDNLKEKTTELENVSGNSADKIVKLTDVLNKRYDELQVKVADGLGQLKQFDKDLALSTENLMVQAANSVESLNQVSELMQKRTSSLTEASSIVVTQSQISETSLAQQQKYITDTATRVEEIKSELKRQIDELASASEVLEKDAVNILDVLKTNISKMLGQCNEALNKSKNINDNLLEQANQFDTSANRTLTKVTQFENVLIKQSQNMENLVKNIDDKTEYVAKVLGEHTQLLDTTTSKSESILNKSIIDFESKSKNIQNISKSASDYINSVTTGLDEKVAGLNVLFRQQEADFYAYSEKVSEDTNKMAEILKKQMKGIEEGADKLFARLVILEEDTGRRAETVVSNSQKSIQELAEIEKTLAEKHELTEKTVDETINKLSSVNDKVVECLQGFDVTVTKVNENLDASLNKMNESSLRLQDLEGNLLKNNDATWQKLNEQTKYMEGVGIKLSSQGEAIVGMLENQRNNISEVANNLATQARLSEASLAQQYKYLTDALVDTTTKMQDINALFKQNTGGIFDVTNKLSYEFDVLGDRLLKACDAVNKAAKDSIKSIDQTSLRLNQCSEDLDSTIYRSVENIGGVFNEYEKYLAGFNTVTAETSTGVFEINNLISAQSDKMVKISEDTKKLVECFNTVLNDTSNQLADRANDAYDKVRSLGQDLKKLGMEMDDAAKLSATHLEKSGDKLRASINEIAANAERISNTILSSGEVFVKQSNALTEMAENTAMKVNQSIGTLVEAGKTFEEQGLSIVKESIRFNDTVVAQTKALNDNTIKAEKAMNELSSEYKDIKIDMFLNDSAKIINILESVSVDINRLLNPKDEEDLWKKFYNGDTQVFIRSIAKNMNNSQINLLRKEFEKNDNLRKLVNTYMQEFEILVEKSKKHEHSAVLMAVISGADLGRLYYILAKALNKLN